VKAPSPVSCAAVVAASALLMACTAGGSARADAAAGIARDSAVSWTDAAIAGAARLRALYVPADGFAYRDVGGRLTGVTVEIMEAFARHVEQQHGVDIQLDWVEEQDWRTFYARVRDATGGVFGVGNVTITEARRGELAFSPSYLTNVAVLITHESVPEITALAQARQAFAGLDALGFGGTLHEKRVRALRDAYVPDARVLLAGSNAEILELVGDGCCFAWIDVYNFWRAREQHAPLRRHAVGDDPAEDFGIIMPHDNDWAPLLQHFFDADGGFRSGAEYRSILQRHLGPGLTDALEAARLRAQ
jgi:ABC-type amino acid transport substrate-binding protein